MYYLVKGEINVTPYMESGEMCEELRLVEADSPQEAEEKFRGYFDDKTDEYSIYYSVWAVDVIETIL